MHILLIHQAFASPEEPGGTRHYELARRLVQQGYSFTIVASARSYLTENRAVVQKGFVTRQDLDGVRILRTYSYPSLHRSFVWRVASFFSFILPSMWAAFRAGPVDLVMGTSPPIFQAVSSWIIAKIRRRPFLLEIRDLWPAFAIDMGVLKSPLLIALSRWLERFLYNRATHILINSPAYRDYLIDKGIPSARISLIPNGADVDMFTPHTQGERVRQTWKLTGRFVIAYVGALGLANDIPNILRAANRLREQSRIHFLIVGGGKERSNMEALARQLQLPNVTFTGPRPRSEVPEILAAADICLATLKDIPMFRMTYPNKIFDYMAAGRPVIVAIDGVIRQVVEASGSGIFVPPGDDAALAEAAHSLSQDVARARAMGAAARAYVVEHFNRSQQAFQLARLVEDLAGGERDFGKRR